jgi:hypothetical protein
VVHVVLSATHHLCGGDPLLAARTLCPVPPGAPTAPRTAHYCKSSFHQLNLIQLKTSCNSKSSRLRPHIALYISRHSHFTRMSESPYSTICIRIPGVRMFFRQSLLSAIIRISK